MKYVKKVFESTMMFVFTGALGLVISTSSSAAAGGPQADIKGPTIFTNSVLNPNVMNRFLCPDGRLVTSTNGDNLLTTTLYEYFGGYFPSETSCLDSCRLSLDASVPGSVDRMQCGEGAWMETDSCSCKADDDGGFKYSITGWCCVPN